MLTTNQRDILAGVITYYGMANQLYCDELHLKGLIRNYEWHRENIEKACVEGEKDVGRTVQEMY